MDEFYLEGSTITWSHLNFLSYVLCNEAYYCSRIKHSILIPGLEMSAHLKNWQLLPWSREVLSLHVINIWLPCWRGPKKSPSDHVQKRSTVFPAVQPPCQVLRQMNVAIWDFSDQWKHLVNTTEWPSQCLTPEKKCRTKPCLTSWPTKQCDTKWLLNM